MMKTEDKEISILWSNIDKNMREVMIVVCAVTLLLVLSMLYFASVIII